MRRGWQILWIGSALGLFLACQEDPSSAPAPAPSTVAPVSSESAPANVVATPESVEAARPSEEKPQFRLKVERVTAMPASQGIVGTVTTVEPAEAEPKARAR